MSSTRRNFIRNTGLTSLGLTTIPAFGYTIFTKKSLPEDHIIGQGDFRYKVNRNWAKISRAHTPLLNCHEMQMDKNGRILMLGDNAKNNILVFDKSGKLLDYWGTNYPGGHGLTLHDEGGEDVLYIVDCGFFQDSNGKTHKQAGKIHKTTIDGRLIFSLPDPRTIGAYAQEESYNPTETAIGPNGDIYVADGYGSNYILQFDHKGQFKKKWGGSNNKDANYNFMTAHGVAIDYRDKNNPVLICTSRGEQSFKFFTLEGEFIKTLELPGAFVCRAVLDDENIYSGVCWSATREGEKGNRTNGFVTILDGVNKVVSNPGGEEPVYVDGKLQQIHHSKNPVFEHGHDVYVDNDKNVYVCQWNAQGTPPIKLERV